MIELPAPSDIEQITLDHIKAAQAGSLKARDVLASAIDGMIRDNDRSWLNFLAAGVKHFYQNNLTDVQRVKSGAFGASSETLAFAEGTDDALRERLQRAKRTFGAPLIYLWAEATSKAIAAGDLTLPG